MEIALQQDRQGIQPLRLDHAQAGLHLRRPRHRRRPSSTRNFGMAWGVGGWLLTPFLQKIGRPEAGRLRERVVDELKTTFASHYTKEVSLRRGARSRGHRRLQQARDRREVPDQSEQGLRLALRWAGATSHLTLRACEFFDQVIRWGRVTPVTRHAVGTREEDAPLEWRAPSAAPSRIKSSRALRVSGGVARPAEIVPLLALSFLGQDRGRGATCDDTARRQPAEAHALPADPQAAEAAASGQRARRRVDDRQCRELESVGRHAADRAAAADGTAAAA